jgi:hypothetical protein
MNISTIFTSTVWQISCAHEQKAHGQDAAVGDVDRRGYGGQQKGSISIL